MKKFIMLTLTLCLLLCACGGSNDDTKNTTAAPVETTQAPAVTTQAETTEATTAPVETTQAAPDKLALAQSCIDKTVQELYDLIGEPDSFDYAPSCLGDGEDGNLYYDGFTVYTYKEGDVETVTYVE